MSKRPIARCTECGAESAPDNVGAHVIRHKPECSEAEVAALTQVAEAARRIIDCEHTRCPHDEEADELWEYADYEGKTWNRCRSCGVLELWEGGSFIRATHPALDGLVGLHEQETK